MPKTTEINELSSKLEELLKKHMPKAGETAIFQVLRPAVEVETVTSNNYRTKTTRTANSLSLKRIQTILDPGTDQPVRIANITGYRPSAVPGLPQEPIIRVVSFDGANGGKIIVGPSEPTLFARLALDDKNEDSLNPSKRRPAGGYLYKRLRPDLTAKEKYELGVKVLEAKAAVHELDKSELPDLVQKLNKPIVDQGRTLSEYELRNILIEVAEANPQTLLDALDAGERKLDKLVAAAVAAKFVTFVEEGGVNEWRITASQEVITPSLSGYAPEKALVRYIQNNQNGEAFSKTLAAAVASAKKK